MVQIVYFMFKFLYCMFEVGCIVCLRLYIVFLRLYIVCLRFILYIVCLRLYIVYLMIYNVCLRLYIVCLRLYIVYCTGILQETRFSISVDSYCNGSKNKDMINFRTNKQNVFKSFFTFISFIAYY